MAAINGNAEICREYRKKNPDMPTAKLARLIYKENKLSFDSEEQARSSLRYIEGKVGKTMRERVVDTEFFKEEHRSTNPYNLPSSDETIYEPYLLNGARIGGLFDIHVPYHNIPALTGAIGWLKQKEPDTILIGGDGIDCHQLSRFVKDPKKRSFAYELDTLGELIYAIRTEFPNAKIEYKDGNHEERYNAFLYQKAGELHGIPEFTLEALIKKRCGDDINFISNKRILKAGDLNIIHGHEFYGGGFSPVNIARGLLLRGKGSAMQGHNHQTSEHTETDMNGRITTTWSVGCLSELHPDYMPLNKWNHGFAFIEVESDGNFNVQNKRIHKGEVL